jgi:RNA polymerase sigma-70 factor, ECF subfamily
LSNFCCISVEGCRNFDWTKTNTMSATDFNNQLSSLSGPLHTFAYKLTKNSEEAKDLYQETAFRAISNVDKFIPGTNLKAWLLTIMKNIFINNYRKNMKTRTIIDSTENLYYINSGAASISNSAESNIMMNELNTMVDNLDESLRVPFEMHYLGHKYQEIADTLNLPLGTVKSRIFFARKELKDMIEKRYHTLRP